MALFVF